MRSLSLVAAWAALLSQVQCLNILITSNDGFGTASVRELYRQMTSLGHNCYVVASVTAQTGEGVRADFTSNPRLDSDGDWGLVKAGAPSLGTDPTDSHIWYYNGTATAQVLVALDYILPTVCGLTVPDLIISGPNSNSNSGAFLQTLSGAMGATYVAIERGIPAMAFWTGNDATVYSSLNSSTRVGLQDPATINARLASNLAQAFISKANGDRVLPEGYGVTVDLPYITSETSDECTNPPFVLARPAQEVGVKVAYNHKSGIFNRMQADASPNKVEVTNIEGTVDPKCLSAVTVFALDYDAVRRRQCFNLADVTAIIPVVVHSNGSTALIGGLGANASISGNSSQSPPAVVISPPSIQTAVTSIATLVQWSISSLVLGLVVGVVSS
ncbi:putative acid phosphatase [Triangularia verruculosa]|uniref:Acid phosphatase n=1 Tax=Triangularia verruculosa TaxID=2587418 RepID=A0AAN6XQ69_9PEZI|nr:putative acid phosphatase [Triangularia verruculosa]